MFKFCLPRELTPRKSTFSFTGNRFDLEEAHCNKEMKMSQSNYSSIHEKLESPKYTAYEEASIKKTVCQVGHRWSLVRMRFLDNPMVSGRLPTIKSLKQNFHELSMDFCLGSNSLRGRKGFVKNQYLSETPVQYGFSHILLIVDKGMRMIRERVVDHTHNLKASLSFSNFQRIYCLHSHLMQLLVLSSI
jgi:hypothetical protein